MKKIIVPLILLFFLISSAAVFIFHGKYFFSSDYVTARGTIVSVATNPDMGPQYMWRANIVFQTDKGESITFTQALRNRKLQDSSFLYNKGDVVDILYNKNNPSDAVIKQNWVYWLMFASSAVLIVGAGLYYKFGKSSKVLSW